MPRTHSRKKPRSMFTRRRSREYLRVARASSSRPREVFDNPTTVARGPAARSNRPISPALNRPFHPLLPPLRRDPQNEPSPVGSMRNRLPGEYAIREGDRIACRVGVEDDEAEDAAGEDATTSLVLLGDAMPAFKHVRPPSTTCRRRSLTGPPRRWRNDGCSLVCDLQGGILTPRTIPASDPVIRRRR